MRLRTLAICTLTAILTAAAVPTSAQESLWLEAEHFDGLRGYCWPMGRPEMKKTAGHWALSGPGWAAEWNQGGESGFLSIATAADDDKAVVTKTVDIPIAGTYYVWVRYGDWREKTERFQIQIEQPGQKLWEGKFGEKPVIEEDNEMKLYWTWAFGWGSASANLQKGPATIKLVSTTKELEPRQIDVVAEAATSSDETQVFPASDGIAYAGASGRGHVFRTLPVIVNV